MSTDIGKIGKPRHRPDTPLDRNVNTRLAAVELAQIKTRAAAEGLSVSSYMRQCAAGTASVTPEIRSQILAAGSATFRAIVPDFGLTFDGMDTLTYGSLAPTRLTWGETGTATEPLPGQAVEPTEVTPLAPETPPE